MTDTNITEIRFDQFDLDSRVIQGLNDTGFQFCTPIQAESIPIAITGQDVAGEAQTGTGKTAAFMVACFDYLLKHPASDSRRPNQPRALILAPTRELAIQIHKDALTIGQHTGLKLGLAYGGTGYDAQRKQLEDGVDILIGTPGRIIDYFKQHVFDLKACQCVVLDEADRMFDLGFIKDIRYLLNHCPAPEDRLSLLFSATLSHRISELAYDHMKDPVEVRIKANTKTADKVKQTVYYPANDEKIPLLLGLMKSLEAKRSIVFVNTKRVAEEVDAWLEGNDIKSALLSGDVPQTKRQTLLDKFEKDEFSVMVATDVAARGLHVPEISHVFNFDLPQSGEDYVHRVGRTARAGASGAAISFACEDYAHYLMDIEEYIGHRVNNEPVTGALLAEPKPRAKRERRKPKPGQHGGQNRSHSGGRSYSGNRNRSQGGR